LEGVTSMVYRHVFVIEIYIKEPNSVSKDGREANEHLTV
jgi:hypothetical protein